MAKTSVGTAHRHKDSRGRWVTEEQPHTHAIDIASFTAAEVKQLLTAGGFGGTVPIPNPPPGPTPDITAPTVSGVSASVTTTTATVVATTNEAATVQVEYSTTGVWPGTLTAATSSGTSHSRTLTGLTPGQPYVYRIRATDTAGNLRLDGNRTFTTTAVATLPGAPTGLVATGGNTQVVLTWAAPSNNGGSAITGYRLYRNGASLVVLGNVLTYTNTGLTNGLTYTYTVAAITAVGEGPQSGSAFATPAAGGDINPPIISSLVIDLITTTSARVSWSLNEGGTGQVEYGLTTGYGTLSTLEAGYLTGHIQTLSGLQPNRLYHLRVRSADAAGNLALSSDRTFTTAAVSVPAGGYPADTTPAFVASPSIPSVPAYLTPYTDPTWGTRITRVSNVDERRNYYANIGAWNSDQTRILLSFPPNTPALLNGSDYSQIRTMGALLGFHSWSNIDPNKIFGTYDNDNHLYTQNMTTDAQTAIKTFTGYDHVSLGNSEGQIDDNDRYVALLTRAGSTYGVLMYDIVGNVIAGSRTFSGNVADLCQTSRLGNYVIVNFSADGAGAEKGVWRYDRNLVALSQLSTAGGNHGDVGLDASGNEIFCYHEDAINSYRLSSGVKTQLLPTGTAWGPGHMSCRNINRPGWCYVSSYDWDNTAGDIGRDQIAALKTDGSGTVEVFGFANHRSNTYAEMPFAVPSRDGKKVLFGSEWGNPGTVYAYIAEAQP